MWIQQQALHQKILRLTITSRYAEKYSGRKWHKPSKIIRQLKESTMNKIDLTKIYTVSQLKIAVKNSGSYFFEPATMRFFNSVVCKGVKHTEGGNVFITSEKFDWNFPRLYTVRILRENGEIDDIGKFQQYATLDQARRAVREL
jgi:hypothetical protein